MYETPVFEVYLDILLILNFIMDYFIFWIVSKLTYQKISKKRLGVGALVAALLYCLVVVIPFLRTVHIIMYLILLPLIPIKIIFKPRKTKQWLQFFIIANITALVIGGMSYGIFYWIQEQNTVINMYGQGQKNYSIWLLFFSILASYIIIRSYGYYMQKRNTEIQKLYPVRIVLQDQIVRVEALLDTGNKVYDPITKYPVIIVEYDKIKMILPEEVRRAFGKTKDITSIIEEVSNSELRTRIRLIPYHSLGNPNGILLGFKADFVYIEEDSLESQLVEDVIIGIYQHDLSKENTYHALLHGDLVAY